MIKFSSKTTLVSCNVHARQHLRTMALHLKIFLWLSC